MKRWYHIFFSVIFITSLEAQPRIISFSAPPEVILHEPLNLVFNISHPEHSVGDRVGVVGFLLQLPEHWEIQHAYRLSRGQLEELKRYKNLESFFRSDAGYQLFGVSLSDLPIETDDMLWKIILTVVPRSVGSFTLKVVSCSQTESEAGSRWKPADPADFVGFGQLQSEKFTEVVTVKPPQYNGGQAVAFRDGADAMQIEPVDLPLFIPDKDFTVEFWLKTASLDVSVFSLSKTSPEDLEPDGMHLEVDSEGMPQLIVRDGESVVTVMSHVWIAGGTWHHVALVHRADGGNSSLRDEMLLLLVDGSRSDSLRIFQFPDIQSASLSFGALNREGFVGMVDEFRVWSVARTADEVRHDMERVLQSGAVGLVGLYHFDELSGTVAVNELRVALPDATLHREAKFIASHSPAVREVFRLSVQLRGEEIELTWELSSIEGVGEFIIERRIDRELYEEVGNVDVLRSAEGLTAYVFSYIDRVLSDAGVIRYRIKQINVDSSVRYSDEVKVGKGIPIEFILEQNHPNPFNPTTTITYTILTETHVGLNVYDLVGREVGVLVDQRQGPGSYAIEFDVENYKGLTSGIYFYRLVTGHQSELRKMILAK